MKKNVAYIGCSNREPRLLAWNPMRRKTIGFLCFLCYPFRKTRYSMLKTCMTVKMIHFRIISKQMMKRLKEVWIQYKGNYKGQGAKNNYKPRFRTLGFLNCIWHSLYQEKVKLTQSSTLKTHTYTLLQKKCTLIYPSSPGDPGSLILTQGHFNFVKWSWQQYAKDPIEKLF